MRWIARIVAVMVIVFCLVIKFTIRGGGGWFMILGVFFYPIASVVHFLSHSIAVRRLRTVQPSVLGLMAVSHVLFILAFLLQYDAGDGPDWLTITELAGGGPAPHWWPEGGIMNPCVFIPVAATWALLLTRRSQGEA